MQVLGVTWTSPCCSNAHRSRRSPGSRSTWKRRSSGRLSRPIQLVVLNGAPPDLVHRVLRDGQLLCERDRSARIRFVEAVRRRLGV